MLDQAQLMVTPTFRHPRRPGPTLSPLAQYPPAERYPVPPTRVLTRHHCRLQRPHRIPNYTLLNPHLQPTGPYSAKILRLSPIAYWWLAEASGTDAFCQVDSNQDGTHTGVTLGQTGIGDGKTCPLYDGVNDSTNIYTATLAGAFDGAEGSVLIWAKVADVGVWTDDNIRIALSLAYDSSTNVIKLFRHSNDSTLDWFYEAGNVNKRVTVSGFSDVDWMTLALTWSATADQLKAYKDGAQVGATQTGLGTWAGALANIRCVIGDRLSYTSAEPWSGYLAHCAVWDTPLTPAQVATLSAL